ncbi:MAG: hypothetical protein ACLUJG_08480 [Lawsonibacter sp.]
MGAALCATDYQPVPLRGAAEKAGATAPTATTPVDTMPPLFSSQAEYEAFAARHNAKPPPEVDIHTYSGPAWLGIDAGSTTTKVALITADGGLLLYLLPLQPGQPRGHRAGTAAGPSTPCAATVS